MSRVWRSHTGSSPLTRGKLPVGGCRGVQGGLIPAHAGKTARTGHRTPTPGAHPRSRGENLTRVKAGDRVAGSSPLTRGKRYAKKQDGTITRLIPAHAGKTPTICPTTPETWAHPRSRGENSRRGAGITWTRGSSPLTRGKHSSDARGCFEARLIPAHAGKTPPRRERRPPPPAHPRSRGENAHCSASDHLRSGSSPLTRGKHRWQQRRRERQGLIPAHAGKT